MRDNEPFSDMHHALRLFRNPAHSLSPDSVITLEGHRRAMEEIASWPGYGRTPLHQLRSLAARSDVRSIFYKDESVRFELKSFKALGGSYAVGRLLQQIMVRLLDRQPTSAELRSGSLSELTRTITVTTATDGNHGRAVAWACRMFGCQCVIYVPKACSAWREAAIAHYGATVIRTDVGYDETNILCAREAEANGWHVVSDSSWSGYTEIPLQIMHGYTVLAEEVLQQIGDSPSPTHIFLQGGVGALAASVSAHFFNRLQAAAPRIIVVEPDGAACLYRSAQAGCPTPAPPPVHTVMAGLDCGAVSLVAWDILAVQASTFVTVPDDVVAPSVKLLARPTPPDPAIVAGESATAGLAAFLIAASSTPLRDQLEIDVDSSILVIGSEGATDPEVYARMLSESDPGS